MTEREKFFCRGFVGVVALYFLYLIKGILLPFVMGIVVAYLCNPLTDKLEKRMPRWLASLLIIVAFTLLIVIAMVFVVPILFNQIIALVKEFSRYFVGADDLLYQKVLETLHSFGIKNGSENLKLYFSHFNDDIIRFLGKTVNNLFSSSVAFVNLILFIFITPITGYYFLRDWHKIAEKLMCFVPASKVKRVRKMLKEMDSVLSAYLRGQFSICLILGIFYAVLLTLVGLRFGLFIGIIGGLLTIMPYVGAFLGAILGLTVAYFQMGFDLTYLSIILAVFALGQFLEGNFVTPNLMGSKIHLHPMWIIFALFAGGVLAGFWGVVLSLPAVAVLNVFLRFLIEEHRHNGKYR